MATKPASAMAGSTIGPAILTPMPRLTKTPVPMIEPKPSITAPGKFRVRSSWASFASEFTWQKTIV